MKAIPLLLALVINISLHCMELDQASYDTSQEVTWAQGNAFDLMKKGILFKDCLTNEEQNLLLQHSPNPETIRTLGHSSNICSIAYNPHNPDELATGCNDGTFHIWNHSTGERLTSLTYLKGILCIAYNPHNPHQLAIGISGGEIVLWDPIARKTLQTPKKFPDGSMVVTYNPHDANQLAIYANLQGNSTKIYIRDHTTGEELQTLQYPVVAHIPEYNPHDPKQLATTTSCRDNKVYLCDHTTGKELSSLKHPTGVMKAIYNPRDPTQLATRCHDNKIHIWNHKTGKQISELEHDDRVWAYAYNPHLASHMITGCNDGATIIIWNLTTNEKLKILKPPQNIGNFCYNPHNPHQLAIPSKDNKVYIWDISALHTVQIFLDAPKKYLSELFFLKRLARAIKQHDYDSIFLSEFIFNVNRKCPLDLDNPPKDAAERATWERKLIKWIPGGVEHNQQKEYFWRFMQMPEAIKIMARKVIKFEQE